ncbi:hypothetical protein BDB01DRAFT_837051 [Pilobolus umbonatus]|nr:hypothetical protein BDB01DRAFT_837051 [Pilobolus umbonatus]
MLQWITSWYQQTPSQESCIESYEATEKNDDWVEIHLPIAKQDKITTTPTILTPALEHEKIMNDIPTTALIPDTPSVDTAITSQPPISLSIATMANEIKLRETLPEKKMSRQEKRAKARFAVKDKKKQDRTAAMIMCYRGKPMCHPAQPLTIDQS